MPEPYGSLDNPPHLGPFRRIVNVHWATDRFVAFPLRIQRRSVVKDYPFPAMAIGEVGQTEQPVDWTVDFEGSPSGPGSAHDVTYVTGFQYEYGAGATPAAGYGGYRRLASGGWSTRHIDAFAGLPTLPAEQTVAPWTVLFFVLGTTDTVLSWWPRAEYQTISGAPIDDGHGNNLAIPGRNDIPFADIGSATLQMRGIQFTGGPLQGTDEDLGRTPYTDTFSNVKYGTTGFVDVGTEAGIDYVFAEFPIDVTGIEVTIAGKVYRGVGAALEPPVTIAPTSPGVLWVLAEKESDVTA